jgi:phosphoserine phosphatase
MKRVDLYIKLELEIDEDENTEKVAGEIVRQLEKLYVVRRAEVSNAVARE